MDRTRRNLLLVSFMIAASVLALFLRPSHRIVDSGVKIDLETMIPDRFGEWRIVQGQSRQIINPLQKEMLDRIYNQTLSRTYVDAKGNHIMLSIAYGADQSDEKQLHYPEVCYPAQGFQVVSTSYAYLRTSYGVIPAKRLITVMGSRSEPLTYWTTVGNRVVLDARQSKIEQLRYGFRGLIPDGLVFRVSTITGDANAAFLRQEAFVAALTEALPADLRPRITGLATGG